MTMKKQDRKQGYADIVNLMLKGNNKEAFSKLTLMCGEDTGLFIMVDYEKHLEKIKDASERNSMIASACNEHCYKWPAELVTGIMYFNGCRITQDEFNKHADEVKYP